jgi:hypothetical protein
MAALFPVYYVVRPKQDLLTFLAEHPDAAHLREAVVVRHEEGFPVDHDYPGQTADSATFAKLCYLAKLERDRVDWSRDSLLGAEATALSELLGSVPMTIATFDRWWSLERLGLGFADLDELLENVPLDVLKKIEGPRERSPLAEEAAREEERRNVERRKSEFDDVTGLPRSEVTWERPGLPEWPSPVGTWWDEIIAKRAQGSKSS